MYFLQQYVLPYGHTSLSIKHCQKIIITHCLHATYRVKSTAFDVFNGWKPWYRVNSQAVTNASYIINTTLKLIDKNQVNCKQLFRIYWLQITNNMHMHMLFSINHLIICNQRAKIYTHKHTKTVQIPWSCKANIVHQHFATNSKKISLMIFILKW